MLYKSSSTPKIEILSQVTQIRVSSSINIFRHRIASKLGCITRRHVSLISLFYSMVTRERGGARLNNRGRIYEPTYREFRSRSAIQHRRVSART